MMSDSMPKASLSARSAYESGYDPAGMIPNRCSIEEDLKFVFVVATGKPMG